MSNRDFVLGDSTGLISELNESEEEGEDELVLSIPHPVKAEDNSDLAAAHPKVKREPDTQFVSQPTKYARHEPIKEEYSVKEEVRTQALESVKKSDLDNSDFRDRYIKSPRFEPKELGEFTLSYRKRFIGKSSSPVTAVRHRSTYTRSPVTNPVAPATLATPTEFQSSPSSTISDFYQLPVREHGNDSLERNVSCLNITKEDVKKELPTPAREHFSPVHQSPPPNQRYASPIKTPENIPNASSIRSEVSQSSAYRNDLPRSGSPRSSDPIPTSNNGTASRNGSAIDQDPPSLRKVRVESPVHTSNGHPLKKENGFVTPALPFKPPKPRIEDPFQIPNNSHIPNIPRPGENVSVNKNDYSILRLVGEGASGKVFQVYSHTHSDIFALKWVLIKKEEDRQSILNEIKLLVSLRNETSIVRLYDHCNTPKVIYMIMEYGDVSFQQIIANQANKKWDLTFIRYYWLQMLNAVNTIHEHNIVHSDLKPANFVIVKGYLKLIDFGIAKRVSDDTTNIERDVPVSQGHYLS
ncbi:unnamed protein product [Mucor hiemalis]